MSQVEPQIFRELQQRQEATANSAKSKAESLEREVLYLSKRVERLSLACQALWEILRETSQMEDDQIVTRMEEIDLRDGSMDGKITRRPIACLVCKRMGNSARTECLYCSAPLPRENIFE